MLYYFIHLSVTVYSYLLLARMIGSWFPSFYHTKIMQFLIHYTDPYLNLFRRWIPPIGILDISFLVAYFVLRIAEKLLYRLL